MVEKNLRDDNDDSSVIFPKQCVLYRLLTLSLMVYEINMNTPLDAFNIATTTENIKFVKNDSTTWETHEKPVSRKSLRQIENSFRLERVEETRGLDFIL